MSTPAALGVRLRPMTDADRDDMFALESDVLGANMIAFLPREPGDEVAFDTQWQKLLHPEPGNMTRIVEVDGEFAGYALSFLMEGERQVGYWIVQSMWGRGVARAALDALLTELPERPLWGRVAFDNAPSRRVLERAGFRHVATERDFSPRRGHDIDEIVLRLD